jgi:hypothetical protein
MKQLTHDNGIKVRFNLGRGANFKKWKITHPNGLTSYLDPNQVQLILYNCYLINRESQSKEIFNGGHKRVCAWVLCETIEIHEKDAFDTSDLVKISFNPRIKPNWLVNDVISDNHFFNTIKTSENKLFLDLDNNEIEH